MSKNDQPELSFSSTVPKDLVHRAAICEVFLTDSVKRADQEFVLAAQLPRVHSYYSDQIGYPERYDPMLLLECCRQATILIAHRYCDVPTDFKFILNSSLIRVSDPSALLIGARPGNAVLTATMTGRKQRNNTLTGFDLSVLIAVDGKSAGSVDMDIQWMAPLVWTKLRDRGRKSLALSSLQSSYPQTSTAGRLAPSTVGRSLERNVVLGKTTVDDGEVISEVLVDQSHPGLFDHALDHVPGMLLFEAIRQMAIVTAHELQGLSPQRLLMTRCRAAFSRFAEFELPLTCRARLGQRPDNDTAAANIVFPVSTLVELMVQQGNVDIGGGPVELFVNYSAGRHDQWTRHSRSIGDEQAVHLV